MPWSKIKPEIDESDYLNSCKTSERRIPYAQSIREALSQALVQDPSVFLMGQGIDDPSGMFGTTTGLQDEFGSTRVFDTPLPEAPLQVFALVPA